MLNRNKYGIRVRSRLSEIFNKINVSGSDLIGQELELLNFKICTNVE